MIIFLSVEKISFRIHYSAILFSNDLLLHDFPFRRLCLQAKRTNNSERNRINRPSPIFVETSLCIVTFPDDTLEQSLN